MKRPDPIRRNAAPLLVAEHVRRLGLLVGIPAQGEWWPWDARDYCLDAPERMPAGSCWALVMPSGRYYPEQRLAYREDQA